MKRRALFTDTPFIYRPVFQVVIEGHSRTPPTHTHTLLTPSNSPTNPLRLIFYLTAPPSPKHTYRYRHNPPLNTMTFPIQFHPAFFSPSSVLDLCPNWFEAYSLTQMHAKFDSLHSVVLLSSLAHSLLTLLSAFLNCSSSSWTVQNDPMKVVSQKEWGPAAKEREKKHRSTSTGITILTWKK